MKCVLGFSQISESILVIKLKGNPFNIFIIVVYALTAQSKEKEIGKFYSMLNNAKTQCKSQEIIIVMRNLNARLDNERNGEIVGKCGLGIHNNCREK